MSSLSWSKVKIWELKANGLAGMKNGMFWNKIIWEQDNRCLSPKIEFEIVDEDDSVNDCVCWCIPIRDLDQSCLVICDHTPLI